MQSECTHPAEHMVCWTSTQYPHRLCVTGLVQRCACVCAVHVNSYLCCAYAWCTLCVAMWPEVMLCSVTFCWWYVHATAPCPARAVAQARPTMPCICLVTRCCYKSIQVGVWLIGKSCSCSRLCFWLCSWNVIWPWQANLRVNCASSYLRTVSCMLHEPNDWFICVYSLQAMETYVRLLLGFGT